MSKPVKLLVCMKHKQISSGTFWIPVSDEFLNGLGRNGVTHLVFCNCDECLLDGQTPKEKGNEKATILAKKL